jgi:hypothetical protein
MILLPPFKGTQVKSRKQVYLNDKEERIKNLPHVSLTKKAPGIRGLEYYSVDTDSYLHSSNPLSK